MYIDLLRQNPIKCMDRWESGGPGKHVVFLLCVPSITVLIQSLHGTGMDMIDFIISSDMWQNVMFDFYHYIMKNMSPRNLEIQ